MLFLFFFSLLVKIRWLFIKAGCLIIDSLFFLKSWLPALLHKEDAVAVVFFWQVGLGGSAKSFPNTQTKGPVCEAESV